MDFIVVEKDWTVVEKDCTVVEKDCIVAETDCIVVKKDSIVLEKVCIVDETQVTILRKIRGNSQESFTGKSGENVDSFSQDFLVTHSQEPGPRNFL